ncbi:MAG: uroporphyrinogen-III synthase [Gammaproteobacteria bacterium]|nr:uroporphyrinogen-III synthase [Gammaproteobacteria bacterium]
MNESVRPLASRTIAIPETRQLDLLADMLEQRGAQVIRCPLVAILDAPDPVPIEAWLKDFIARPCDDLILLTGEGLRRLVGFADRAGLKDDFVESIKRVRTITRGPKPGRALKEINLKPDLLAEAPTTDGVIATLEKEDLKNRRIGVQLYATDPNEKLITYLRSQEATVLPVSPYIYASKLEEGEVLSLIDSLQAGEIDVIAFTSQPQYQRLAAVAKVHGRAESLHQSLVKTTIAAVGPVVKKALSDAGIPVEITPDSSFFMKPLVRKMVEVLGK